MIRTDWLIINKLICVLSNFKDMGRLGEKFNNFLIWRPIFYFLVLNGRQ